MTFLKSLMAAACLIMPAVPVSADPVVVELFTSQGCSSCPPADAMLAELSLREDVLPLALHVDYWDYIGWADTFGDPAHTIRQQSYAQMAGSSVVYTPQTVIGGADQVVGTRPMEVARLIQNHSTQPETLTLDVSQGAEGRLTIRIAALDAAPSGAMLVQVVGYRPEASVEITRGENAGEHMVYSNIVMHWQIVDRWDGEAPFEAHLPRPDTERVAVIVQEEGPGRVLAAARLPE